MSRFSRPLLLAVLLAFLSLLAGDPTPSLASDNVSAHELAIQSPIGKFIQDLGNHAVKIISDKQLSSEERNSEFSKLLNSSFDLTTIGRFVIGRTWNAATQDQQAEYMDLFKKLLIKNYGDRMSLAAGENFQVVGIRSESEVDSIVLSQVTHPDGSKPTTIDWRVRHKDNKMGVIDVTVEGISLSVTQRQEYGSIIQNDGGHIDGLLEAMRNQLNADNTSTRSSQQ